MPKKYKSAETINESDLEDDSPVAERPASPPPKVSSKRKAPPTPDPKPQKRPKTQAKPPASSSSDSSTDDDEEEGSKESNTKAQRNGDGDSESASDGESESAESSSGSENASTRRASPSKSTSNSRVDATRHSESKTQSTASQPVAVPVTYTPPAGFEKVSVLSIDHPAYDLSNKQLWHITCPASASPKSISELSSEQVYSGAKLKLSGNARYTFKRSRAGLDGDLQLLIPKKNGTYKAVEKGFEETLNLQIVTEPENRNGTPIEKTEQPIAKQPEGLKARYWPPGFEPKSKSSPASLEPEAKKPSKPNSSSIIKKPEHKLSRKPLPSPSSSSSESGSESDASSSGGSSVALLQTASEEGPHEEDSAMLETSQNVNGRPSVEPPADKSKAKVAEGESPTTKSLPRKPRKGTRTASSSPTTDFKDEKSSRKKATDKPKTQPASEPTTSSSTGSEDEAPPPKKKPTSSISPAPAEQSRSSPASSTDEGPPPKKPTPSGASRNKPKQAKSESSSSTSSSEDEPPSPKKHNPPNGASRHSPKRPKSESPSSSSKSDNESPHQRKQPNGTSTLSHKRSPPVSKPPSSSSSSASDDEKPLPQTALANGTRKPVKSSPSSGPPADALSKHGTPKKLPNANMQSPKDAARRKEVVPVAETDSSNESSASESESESESSSDGVSNDGSVELGTTAKQASAGAVEKMKRL